MTGSSSAHRVTEGVFAVFAVTIPMVAIFLLSLRWQDVLWDRDLQTTEVIVGIFGACVAFAAFVIAEKLVSHSVHPILPAINGLLCTALVYTAVQGYAYWDDTRDSRQAEQSAAEWPVVFADAFDRPESMPEPERSQYGLGRTEIQNGKLVVALESARDFTYWWPDRTPTLSDLYVATDVQMLQGPDDAFCGVLVGWQGDERWIGIKVGNSKVQVTQNVGTLPHRRLMDATGVKTFESSQVSRLGIYVAGETMRVFINNRLVANDIRIQGAVGQVRFAAQAARNPDDVRCSFDNIEVRGLAA
jgi:hypothetical protein